ncbi:MAG TPA: ABC transporter substrate-binding protein [Streptosporangiaceae bacterium]|jgi:NitT/TauT family transport system substrate-binding protein|nr:ABC transporter substrate-binding protein [Streptosporangiaceae bacterium]
MTFGRIVRFFVVPLVAALGLTACGGDKPSSSGTGPEKTHITVGTLPVPDAAPLFIAIERGFFKAEGLTVKPELIQSSPLATPKLVAETMDFSLLNYVSTFSIQEKGAVKFKLVADAFEAGPNGFLVLTSQDSDIREPDDLVGKKIAQPALSGIGPLAVAATLKNHGLDQSKVTFVPMPFPNMEAALKAGAVDAVWVTEPFITSIQKNLAARTVADTMSGPMADFPIAGWGTVAQYTSKYPKTVAAFRRAMARAQRIAAADRKVVQEILPSYTQIDAHTAGLISLGTYPTSLNPTRLQRVADVMQQFGHLRTSIDVGSMILSDARG